MKKLFLIAAFWLGLTSLALAQNPQCPTRPPGDSTNACASTAFVTGGIAASAITALTGDATATGPGSVPLTLATVNANVGTFGDATHCVTFTTNGKGLITAASTATCTPAFSSLTGQGTLAQLPQLTANSIFINPTGSAAQPQSIAVPACANDGAHALVYVNGTGLACETITSAGGTVTTAGTGLTLTGGGTTLNLALTNQTVVATPSNPANLSATGGAMVGLGVTGSTGGCRVAPTYSTRVTVTIDGVVGNNTASQTVSLNMRFGTGTAPANNASPTGTVVGATKTYGMAAISNADFSLTRSITGLTPGTTYWIDLLEAVSANTAVMSGVNCNIVEY